MLKRCCGRNRVNSLSAACARTVGLDIRRSKTELAPAATCCTGVLPESWSQSSHNNTKQRCCLTCNFHSALNSDVVLRLATKRIQRKIRKRAIGYLKMTRHRELPA